MGVVRIDDGLEKEIAEFIKRKENRFKYPSKSTFLNILIHEHLKRQSRSKKEVK